MELLSKRNLAKHGMERGAYDGAQKRRFVLFSRHDATPGNVTRREFDTKRERDQYALAVLSARA